MHTYRQQFISWVLSTVSTVRLQSQSSILFALQFQYSIHFSTLIWCLGAVSQISTLCAKHSARVHLITQWVNNIWVLFWLRALFLTGIASPAFTVGSVVSARHPNQQLQQTLRFQVYCIIVAIEQNIVSFLCTQWVVRYRCYQCFHSLSKRINLLFAFIILYSDV